MSAVGGSDVGEKKEWGAERGREERRLDGRGGGTYEYSEMYYPAGSISSHRDSISLGSSEDASQPAPHSPLFLPLLSDDNPPFQPTTDNIILFEVCSPAPKSSDSFRLDSFDRFKPPRLPLFEDAEASLLFAADEDKPQKIKLFDVSENTLEESWRWGQIATEAEIPPTHASSQFLSTIVHLQQLISQQKWEIDTLKEAKKSVEMAEKGTMTIANDVVLTLRREVEHLSGACKRYERQNQDLRTEIQACTSDLMQLDKAKTKLMRELKKVTAKAEAFEGEFIKISEFVEKVLSRYEAEEPTPSHLEKDPKHLSNYVSSQVEIIGSRYSRLLAAYDRISEENQRLRQTIETPAQPKLTQSPATSCYKPKMVDFQSEIDCDFPTPVLNNTENLSTRLKAICDELQPFRSQHSSPEPPLPPSPDLAPGFSFVDHSRAVQNQGLGASFPSSSDSQNDISEGTMLKPETPVQVKRTAWRQKQSQRHVLFAVDKYRPVLHARGSKEPSFRIGKGDEDASKRTVLTANRQYLGNSQKLDNGNAKKGGLEAGGKAQSVDRKRQRAVTASRK